MSAPRAAVFAYADVGVRGLKSLLAAGFEIPLLVTHADDPKETLWYDSVAATAADNGVPVRHAESAPESDWLAWVREARPDFLFSFYFRKLLPEAMLQLPPRGALNVHGSLLPKYRGRAPVNWAVLHGERETGATLHYMVARADAGDIVDQQAVPIFPDDIAAAVTFKISVAAEIILARSLPLLIAGTAPRRPQPILPGQYFGRRRPEDGRIDWNRSAQEVHNLVRAVAPPFPGAFCFRAGEQRLDIHRTRLPADAPPVPGGPGSIASHSGRCFVRCGDGRAIELLQLAVDARLLPIADFLRGVSPKGLHLY